MDETSREQMDAVSLESRLGEIEKELGDAGARTATLDRHMECIIEVMSNPEDRIRVIPSSVRVTQMGLLVTEESKDPCEAVGYTKIETGDGEEAAIRLVSFPVAEIVAADRFRPRVV